MAVNRDQLFAELEALTEAEIEAGLDAGVWGEDKRQLVEHYLDQLKLTTMQFEAATLRRRRRWRRQLTRRRQTRQRLQPSSSRRGQWQRWHRRSSPSWLFGIGLGECQWVPSARTAIGGRDQLASGYELEL
jgi:hypothetical protein